MDTDEFASWPRRHEEKRRPLEEALRRFVAHYRLPPESVERLSDEVYQLWHAHECSKWLRALNKRIDELFRREVRALARRSAQSPSEDALEHATRMVRLETLERQKVGRGKAIEGACAASFDDLSVREKRKVFRRLEGDVLPGCKVRSPALEVSFLTKIATVIERETGERIKFSSRPSGSKRADQHAERHYGSAFAVMKASALMADYDLTNEALATLIRRIRRSDPDP